MSLLNQMLNDLEKRGANGPLADMPIRAVHAPRNSHVWVYALAGIALVGAIDAMWWISHRPTPELVAVVAPLPAGNASAISQVAIVSQPQAVSQPQLEPQAAAGEPTDTREYAVASHLSSELGSIPLPNSLRGKPLAELAAIQDIPPAAANKSNARIEPTASVSKKLKEVSPQQQAENEFRKANLLAQQGKFKEAAAGYEAALRLDLVHDMAREALVAVSLESKLNADAEKTLQEGLKQNSKQTHFAMLLARLQVERNALPLALETLEKTLPYADQQADYQAFVAALLQRQNRHKEAITHYQLALQMSPNSGLWLMGLGISLQALQRKEDARDAYKRAIESRNLSPELQAFVVQRMKEIKL